MAIDPALRNRLTLPAICAPMFMVTGPALVREACKAGVIGALPRQNSRTFEEFEQHLRDIRRDLDAHALTHPGTRIAPIAVNLSRRLPGDQLDEHLRTCRRYGVDIIISATGDPTELIQHAHAHGAQVFHDVTTLHHAEKAIRAGVDGLTCIGAGGGGHSGTISHLALIPRIREIFDGTIVMAGAVSTGAAIRAAEILGADLAYLGTRFIATKEASVDPRYKELLVSQTSTDLLYTGRITGVPANWMKATMVSQGLDPNALPQPTQKMGSDHLPEHVKPWKNLWSAGQGVDLIHDIPSVADLVLRLRREYVAACEVPDMAKAARLAEQAHDAARVAA